jgi:hypothetical protein
VGVAGPRADDARVGRVPREGAMRRCLVLVVASLLAGCGGVVSEHPASDDATTHVDERLIGFWRADLEASGGKTKDGVDDAVIAIGKGREPASGLEFVLVTVDEEGELEVVRDAVRATAIGGKPYLSVRMTERPAPAEKKSERPTTGWFVLRYDVPEPGVLRVLGMDVPTVAKDVNEKKVAGTVPPSEPGADPESVLVTLSASTEALRAWLESRGDALFKADKPLVLRRLVLR